MPQVGIVGDVKEIVQELSQHFDIDTKQIIEQTQSWRKRLKSMAK